MINARLMLDRSSLSKKYGKKTLNKQKLVSSTWNRLLNKNEQTLAKNWHKSLGLLVGVDQMVHQDGIPDNPDDLPWCMKSHTQSECWFLWWLHSPSLPPPTDIIQLLHCTCYNGQVSNLVSDNVITQMILIIIINNPCATSFRFLCAYGSSFLWHPLHCRFNSLDWLLFI